MSLTFNDGSSNVLVIPDNYEITYDSDRELFVQSVPYSSAVQGMDMIGTVKDLKVTGDLFINPHSSYTTKALMKAAFVALHPGSMKVFSMTDSDGMWTESICLIKHFTLTATKAKPQGLHYSIDVKVITLSLGGS